MPDAKKVPDVTRVSNIALTLSLALALWVIYPLTCFLLSRVYSRQVVNDAETILKGRG